jgi:hypothetical protein
VRKRDAEVEAERESELYETLPGEVSQQQSELRGKSCRVQAIPACSTVVNGFLVGRCFYFGMAFWA